MDTSNVSLDDLIEAIAAAVITAQDRIEKHQIDNLWNYFVPDPNEPDLVRPKAFRIALPSMSDTPATDGADNQKENELKEDWINVPLVAIIPQNQLRIKDVKITFDAEISSLGDSEEEQQILSGMGAEPTQRAQSPAHDIVRKRRKMGVDVGSGLRNKKANTANIVLTVESGEPTEAAARVLHHLTKRI